ncbi:MAG: ROK family protein [Flavobacterium sp.]|nr:ROK family protein [Flavobacterium sp.]
MKRLAIGIDIGGTRTKVGLVDLDKGEVLEMLIAKTETKSSSLFLQMINSGIDQLKEVAQKEQSPVLGVGFGVTGFVFEDGKVDSTYGFLEFMEDYPLSEYIQKHSSLPCRADNDARVVALGEAVYGIGKGQNRVLVLTLGTGLGLGFIDNGKFETALPFAHMGGHISVGNSEIECYCGKKGCLEALVSATGIVASAKRMDWEQKYPHLELNVQTIFKAEQEGNSDAKEIVAEFLAYLKIGIGNYINLFAPDMIIIGGGVSKGMQPYLDELKQIDFLGPYKNYKVKIALSELDEYSGILGSAALFNN